MSIGEERIEQHIFRFVERELYNYPINKKLVENWEKEKEELIGGARSTLSGDGSGRFAENKITNPTSAEVLRLLALENKVNRARWYVQAIDDVLELLPEEDRRLVELKYFQGFLTNVGVARELNIGQTVFYERRAKLVEKFAIRMGLL
jgi:RinA family phage transcriptional activator